jgi:hypothetical protein
MDWDSEAMKRLRVSKGLVRYIYLPGAVRAYVSVETGAKASQAAATPSCFQTPEQRGSSSCQQQPVLLEIAQVVSSTGVALHQWRKSLMGPFTIFF